MDLSVLKVLISSNLITKYRKKSQDKNTFTRVTKDFPTIFTAPVEKRHCSRHKTTPKLVWIFDLREKEMSTEY